MASGQKSDNASAATAGRRVLVVTADAKTAYQVSSALSVRRCLVRLACDLREAREILANYPAQLILVDMGLGEALLQDEGFGVLAPLVSPPAQWVVVASEVTRDLAVQALRRGCSDILEKPLKAEELADCVERDLAISEAGGQDRGTAEERDILEVQVQHAQKLESLGILAGGIAHDFNNLLVGILGNADLALMDMPPTSPAYASVEEIKQAAIRASELTNQLLAYSGRGRFVVEPVSLNDVVGEMGQLLEVSISKNANLRRDFAARLPLVEADVSQLRQVVMNLILNASDALGGTGGEIMVRTGLRDVTANSQPALVAGERLAEGQYVFLEVADSGCGMDPATRARIYEPFYTTKAKGRGLGLAAVLGIVRAHHGAIEVRSAPGRGSTFTVFLPPSRATRRTHRPPTDTITFPRPSGHGTILVVDDEASVRTVASRMLQRQGYKILMAEDGARGIEVFREHEGEIVAVLLDMTMPKMDGAETFKRLRRIREDVKVILVSGYNERETTTRFPGKGLDAFIQKPFQAKTLVKTLTKVLAPKLD